MTTNFKFKSTLLFAVLLLLGTQAFAQTGRITGKVTERGSGDVLIGASVLIAGTNIGTAADLEGNFSINSVRAGDHELVISYMGYETQRIPVTVSAGSTTTLNIELTWQGVVGEEIYITAQARGQLSAINQQLRSNTITNIVSADRIRELPDVNAAESIGRLPGVSIQRSGGEANKIAIRGLSPKYNMVTVNGVRLPSTDSHDRSVDLSLVSSNMLDGIEVMKAITADKDADVLGGTVDLRLREAPDNLMVDLNLQGGYNQLQEYYGNYKLSGSASNRFFDGKLGVLVSFSLDEYDRSADKFSGSYTRRDNIEGQVELVPTQIQMREENVTRGRTGANVVFDYRIPNGKVTGNTFYNKLTWDGLYRLNSMQISSPVRHNFHYEQRGGTTTLMTMSAGIEQDFGWMRYDFGVSNTSSDAKNPGERTWFFTREGNSFTSLNLPPNSHPSLIPALAVNDSSRIGIQDVMIYDSKRNENQQGIQFNVQVPFRLGDQINGYIKTGGKLRWLDRMNDEDQHGSNGLYYGNNSGPNPALTTLDNAYPDWGIADYVATYGIFPLAFFQTNYNRPGFLDGEYPLGFVADMNLLNMMTDGLMGSEQYLQNAVGSRGNDYDGIERYRAGYIMAELSLWKYVTIIPGIRYEYDYSRYNGQTFREQTLNNQQADPTDIAVLTAVRENDFWLPMMHVNVDPVSWLKLRFARTETITRPDYYQYAPITRINSDANYMRAANTQLKPAHATNYDAAASVYQNHVGLFTVAAFHKTIDGFTFQINQPMHPHIYETHLPPGMYVPENWIRNAAGNYVAISFGADTFINNPYESTVKGLEFDWQTSLWYLPSFLKGIVLNVNYTRMWSDMRRVELRLVSSDVRVPGPGPVRYYQTIEEVGRDVRLLDQPTHIANITFGYDLKGFSARLSYLFTSDRLTGIGSYSELDSFTNDYVRWDLALQQKFDIGLEFYTNFNNLTSREDQNAIGAIVRNPTYLEYYGFTMDIGVRYRF